MSRMGFLLMSLVSTLGATSESISRWSVVDQIMQAYFPASDFAFSAGDRTGRKHTFEKGTTKMTSPLLMASSSKFPAAIAVMGVVAEGHLTLETKASEVWPWWSSNSADRRSQVTLRQLLSFTSGFYSPDTGGYVPCLGMGSTNYTAEECAREIYQSAPFEFEPGSTWAYNSFHLQVAGAMAATAAKISVQEMLRKHLIQPLNLTGTSWLGGENPMLAAAMVTNGDDYDKILHAHLSHELIPKPLADQMERDYLQPPVKIANSSTFLVHLLGHYSLCNYFECFLPKLTDFTAQCAHKNVHMDAGLFGYYPLVDRSKGTYMQIVRQKLVNSGTDFGPTISSMALRLLLEPFVEWALHPERLESPPELGQVEHLSEEFLWNITFGIIKGAGLEQKYPTPDSLWQLADQVETLQV